MTTPETNAANESKSRVTRMALIVGSGGFAEWLLGFSMNTLVMPVFVTGFGMSATLVGWAITIPRLVDAFSDPFIGHLSDQTQSRWGRRRPFIVGGGVTAAVLFALLWHASPAWSQTAQFTWLLTLSVGLWIAYGCLSISLSALTFEITDDYHDRTRIGAISAFFKILPQLVSGWIYPLALLPIFASEVIGMRWISIGVGVLIVAAVAIPGFFARERFAHHATKHIPLKAGIRQAFSCRPFRHLLATRILITLGSYIFSSMLFYVAVYHVCRGDKILATKILAYYAVLQTVISILLLPLAPKIGRAFGKRTLQILGTACHLGAGLAAWWFLTPETPWLLLALALLYAPAGLLMGIFFGAALPDICDLDELEYGARREGLFSSVTAFITKIEISLSALVTGYMLSFAKLDAGLTTQAVETVERLRWLGITPYILVALAALVIAFAYPVTAAQMAKVREQLAVRRAAAMPPAP